MKGKQNKRWIVYEHISPSGKHYVGITSRKNPNDRWVNGKGYCGHQALFHNAINKYGWENFTHNILYIDCEEVFAKEKEKELIAYYKGLQKSYNMTDGGEGKTGVAPWNKGKKLSEEHKMKDRLSNLGPKNHFYGKHHTEETKRHLSELAKGRIPWNKGIPRTEEEKRKMRESHKGYHPTPESNLKRSQTLKGRIVSDETRKKLSDAIKGRKKSTEQLKNMSKANKGKKWYHNPLTGERTQVYLTHDLNKYISMGWVPGRGY